MWDLWKYTPIILLLLLALWTWHKVMIDKLEMIIRKIEHERDEWKRLAVTLMVKSGISVPRDLLPGSTSFKKKEEK